MKEIIRKPLNEIRWCIKKKNTPAILQQAYSETEYLLGRPIYNKIVWEDVETFEADNA